MRLFLAVRFSEEMNKAILGTMHDLKKKGVKGKFVPAQNLHMTLAFIGETESAEPVKEAIKDIRFKPFRLGLTAPGTFGDVLWIGVKGNQGMNGLVKTLREALDAAGISYDRQKFTPHVTIARKVSGSWKQAAFPKTEMMVKTVSLMKSSEKDGKRVYTEIFSV